MTTLIANIGTSDLAIKVGNSYIPIGFDRNEPNLDKSGLTHEENDTWNRKDELLGTRLCPELGVKVDVTGNQEYKFSFRELTEKLWNAYESEEDKWHDRLRPCRIWGVIQEAKEKFGATNAYIFVTNQVTEKSPNGHVLDSFYLFNILNKWLTKEMPKFTLEGKIIPATIRANDQDTLLDYYYRFFNDHIKSDETLLISIKGGTPQMQTALQIQAISSAAQDQLFLNPILSIKKILAGEYSECLLTSYWRYMRSQKYQTIQQLLSRWDFDGAIQLLKTWQKTLNFIIGKGTQEENILSSQRLIDSLIKALEVAVSYFNLDISGTMKPIKKSEDLAWLKPINTNYDQLLNLYSQCRIYWELNQIANFLSRLGSFCEETLHDIIGKLCRRNYFDKKWKFDPKELESALWNGFYQRELEEFPQTTLKLMDFDRQKCQLQGRLSKRNFAYALIQYRGDERERELWQDIFESLKKLDYWIEKRNDLIHSAKGISKESMSKALESDRRSQHDNRGKDYADIACKPDQILVEMTNISRKTSELLNLPKSSFVGLDAPYYIYSEIKDWVIHKLMTDGLR